MAPAPNPTWVAFLRAINVGGRHVTMATVRGHLADAGLVNVRSKLASGNVTFEATGTAEGLEQLIEAALKERLGYPVATFVRSPDELTAIADAAVVCAKGSHQIGFLKGVPSPDAIDRVIALRSDVDTIEVIDRQIHWHRAEPRASTLSNGSFEKALGAHATFRTVGTVRKLVV